MLLALEEGSSSSDSKSCEGYTPPLPAPNPVPPPPAMEADSNYETPVLRIEGVSLQLPDGRWLLRGFRLAVRALCVRQCMYWWGVF